MVDAPWVTVRLEGETATVKFGAPVTVRVTVVEWVALGAVPVTVSV